VWLAVFPIALLTLFPPWVRVGLVYFGPRTFHERLWHAPSWHQPAYSQRFGAIGEAVVDYPRLALELVAMEVLVVALYLTWAKPTDLDRKK
jgi:hypothetical protein